MLVKYIQEDLKGVVGLDYGASQNRIRIICHFGDVDTTGWYYKAVSTGYTDGLLKGTAATVFAPRQDITAGELLTILYRMAFLKRTKSRTSRLSSSFSRRSSPNSANSTPESWRRKASSSS